MLCVQLLLDLPPFAEAALGHLRVVFFSFGREPGGVSDAARTSRYHPGRCTALEGQTQ